MQEHVNDDNDNAREDISNDVVPIVNSRGQNLSEEVAKFIDRWADESGEE